MKKKIGIGVLSVLVLFFGYVAAQPAEYAISREIAINAPADVVFPHLNNQKLAEKWGPWLEVDPQAKMTYSGPDAGVGSVASWDSSGQLGTGSATIVESIPNQRVGIKLEYTKPMNMTQHSDYIVNAKAGSLTTVTWKVTGKNGFLGRMMCVFMNMDKYVGGMFEKGLSNLKNVVEKQGS